MSTTLHVGDQREVFFPDHRGYRKTIATWTGYSWQIPMGAGGMLAGLFIGSDLFESEMDACKAAWSIAELEVEKAEAQLHKAEEHLNAMRRAHHALLALRRSVALQQGGEE